MRLLKQWTTNDVNEINKLIHFIHTFIKASVSLRDSEELHKVFGYIAINGLVAGMDAISMETLLSKHIIYKVKHTFIEYHPKERTMTIESDKLHNLNMLDLPWLKIDGTKYEKQVSMKDISFPFYFE